MRNLLAPVWALSAALFLLAGCGPNNLLRTLTITVEAESGVIGIAVLDALVATPSGGSTMDSFIADPGPDFVFPVVLPPIDVSSVAGTSTVSIDGLDSASFVTASGSANTSIGDGANSVTVVLSLVGGEFCGDGVANSSEACDGTDLGGDDCVSLGFAAGTLACSATCTHDTSGCTSAGVCGDGTVDPGEECDDGNTADGDGCSSLCGIEPVSCGDGTCDMVGGETCSNCVLDCSGDPACAMFCGDGTADPGEDCDGADLAGETCTGLGFTGGTLACDAACTFNTVGCTGGGVCGDGAVDAGEDCDGANLNGADCTTIGMGFTGGILTCTATCGFDVTGCIADLCSGVDCSAMSDMCNVGTCNPVDGSCFPMPVVDGNPCNDGNACSGNDTCQTGTCTGGPPVVCLDGNACTADSCDPTVGCVFDGTGNTGPCDDGNVCTGDDTCQGDMAGSCVGAVTILEDFESGAPGWTTGDLSGNPAPAVGWMLANVTAGTNPMAFPSTAFGTANNGDQLGYEHSFLQSPIYDLTSSGPIEVSFDTLTANEDFFGFPPAYDAEFFEVSYDGGMSWNILLDEGDPFWLNNGQWDRAIVTIPAGTGTANTTFRFRYNTSDSCCGPPDVVGWFIDDFQIVFPGGLGCADGNTCTADSCNPAAGCLNASISGNCDDGDLCNGPDSCDPVLACVPGTTPLASYEDFETGAPGWFTGALPGPLVPVNGWALSNMSGGLTPVTFSSTAYGTPNQGDQLGHEHSFLQSPAYDLSGGGTVSFYSFVSNENGAVDAEFFEVSYDGGMVWQSLIPTGDLSWCIQAQWAFLEATIPAASGTPSTTFRFRYDTLDGCCGPTDVVGWFIDDFVVRPTGAVDCSDGNPCTLDLCAGACSNTPVLMCNPVPPPFCF